MATLPAFLDVLLPTAISFGSTGGPEFKTLVVATSGGREQRLITWAQARARYNIAYGVRTPDQLSELLNFFRSVHGQALGFRFKDHADYTAGNPAFPNPTDMPFAVGNTTVGPYQLLKIYDLGGGGTYYRTIYKPVENTVQIYGNGDDLTGLWTLNTTGQVTFTEPVPDTMELSWRGEFHVPCRFSSDTLQTNFEQYRIGAVESIEVLEIRL
jgi:uncharacterized protein (TIGR02217 family)